ncbi:MAG: long-chain fatty acid--CoA ligase [Verrucomicrobiota bacterium]|jgi:hypothetical protein
MKNAFASELRGLMREAAASDGGLPDDQFQPLALALFSLQRETVPIYREFCQARNIAPDAVGHWSRIPALPTTAFKEFEVSSIPPAARTRVFHSSTTTGQTPSRHFHHAESLAVYEASLLPWFERSFFGAHNPPMKLIFLTPEDAPHSSLVQMFKTVRRHCATPDSAFTGTLAPDGSWSLDLERTVAPLREAAGENHPLGLLGTAFSFVHLLDHLNAAGKRFLLPKGSRVMETGGYKGRSRELPKSKLRQLLTRLLNVPASAIVTEYGMCELSSQAYERDGVFHFPPWARAQVISPESGAEVALGETGLLRVFDLANIWSVMALQTEDLAVRRVDGFELVGRTTGAQPRGCSLLPGA